MGFCEGTLMIDMTTESGAPARSGQRRRTIAAACLLVATALVGCSSSKDTSPAKSAGQTPVGTDAAIGVSDTAATEITTSYLRFFDSTVAQAERLPLLQDGAEFSQAITEQAKGEFAKAASVQVTKVTVTSAQQAIVIYTLLLDGSPSRSNQTGYAVRENGRWKVAGATFCRLLAEQGAPPPVCRRSPATSLPG
jgi:hypothetical protein